MSKNSNFLLIALILGGCATVKPIQYPLFTDAVTVHVSKDIVSTWTETAAGDSILPDSQVFVAKQGGGLSAFGGLIGVAIDRSGAKSRASDGGEQINQYFDDIVKGFLQKNDINRAIKIALIDDDASAVFKVLPSVRFATDKEKHSLLTFRLTTRYRENEKVQNKNYYFTPSNNNYLLNGVDSWFGEAQKFSQVKARGFSALVETFIDDISGKLKITDPTSTNRVEWKFPWMKKPGDAVVVKQNDDHSVIVPLFREKPMLNTFFIVDNLAVESNSSVSTD